MFLETTIKRNPRLIQAGFDLHQKGWLLPDTYLLDWDVLMDNAQQLLREARKEGLRIYYMGKQVGRNPLIARALENMGYDGAVCVDFREASAMMRQGLKLAHVGHLVQIPARLLKELMEYGIGIITAYSNEKIEEINRTAEELNIVQDVMLKIADPDSLIYDGQRGGFTLTDLKKTAQKAAQWQHVRITGLTSFPCFLYDEEKAQIMPTVNTRQVLEAKRILADQGLVVTEINLPSSNTTASCRLAREWEATSIEPGHALTGTTPSHAASEFGERPAMIYISEVSHNYQGRGYCYGGGFYRRGHLSHALVGSCLAEAAMMGIKGPAAENIDYYLELARSCKISDTVITSFRTQIFTTRSQVAVVKGIQSGMLKILGIYDSQGRLIDE